MGASPRVAPHPVEAGGRGSGGRMGGGEGEGLVSGAGSIMALMRSELYPTHM